MRLETRIGVATGEVVAGDPSSGQAFVTGDVVNVAARLEQAAGPGEVLIADRTHELVHEAVRAEPAGPLELKGKSAPVGAWRLLELTDKPAVTWGLDAPFVGREHDLDVLSGALARAVESRSCQLCTVVGPPGIGKSRVAAEFTGAAKDRCRVVVGRCLPYGKGITYWPLVEIVQSLGGEGIVRDLLPDDEDAAVVAERILGAIGTTEPSGACEETFWAFRKLFEALAHKQPLIAVVDELQWAEPTLLDLLEYLLTFAADEPILLLCMTRPELFDDRPSWAMPRRGATVIALEPLGDAESATLVGTLAAAHGVADVELPGIVETAEGNPLFLEQLLAYRAGKREAAVPPTIQALLAARIDRLDAEERAVLLRAAVEGKTFHRGALAALLPEHARPALGARLISLIRQDLIRPDRSQFPGDDGFRFGHSLIYEAAYESAPKKLRADAHERYADWLDARAGEQLTQSEEILGYHLEQAHRLRAELGRANPELAGRAAQRLARAGDRALARGDIPAALNLLERTLALVADDGTASPELLLALGIARMEAGDLESADHALSDAIERAAQAADPSIAAHAALERARLQLLTGRATPDELRAEAQDAIWALERVGDDLGLARAWLVTVDVHCFGLEMSAVERAAERALAYARRALAPREEADAIFWLCVGALYGQRTVQSAIELCQNLRAEASGPVAEVGATQILAALRLRNDQAAESRELYREAEHLYRELGMRLRAAGCLQCQGTSELTVGDAERAEATLRRSCDELESMGERGYLSTSAAYLAQALCAQGRFEEAARFVKQSEDLTGSEDRLNQVLISSTRARLHAARGEMEVALTLAREAQELASELDDPQLHALALVDLGDVLHSTDRRSEEAAALREAFDLYERKGNRPAAERIRLRLDELEAVSAP